jgi:hypothetical protein
MPVSEIMPEAMAEYIAVADETLSLAMSSGKSRLSIRGKVIQATIAVAAYKAGIPHVPSGPVDLA